MSRSKNSFAVFQYLIALNDVHNFWLSAPKCRSLFREEFLNVKVPLDNVDSNNVFNEQKHDFPISSWGYIDGRKAADAWKYKNYPETRDENIRILDNYLTLCEKNSVRAVMFVPPFSKGYVKHFSKQKLDEFYCIIREAQKKHPNAVFFDGWHLNFLDSDFYDIQHLNLHGAAKFSSILNNIILLLDKIPLNAKVLIK